MYHKITHKQADVAVVRAVNGSLNAVVVANIMDEDSSAQAYYKMQYFPK